MFTQPVIDQRSSFPAVTFTQIESVLSSSIVIKFSLLNEFNDTVRGKCTVLSLVAGGKLSSDSGKLFQ